MSRALRGLLFMIGYASLLAWFHVATTILSTGTIPRGFYVLDLYLSFWMLGIIAFLVSFVFMVLFVIAGAFFGRNTTSGLAWRW